MATSDSIQMAGVDGGRGRPSPEPLQVPVASSRAGFVDGAGHGAADTSPVAGQEAAEVGWKEEDSVTISVLSAQRGRAHVQEMEVPYSVAFSVPASPSGIHLAQLGACASIRSDGDAVRVTPSTEVKLDAHHPGAEPELLKQARYHSQPTLTIRTEEPPLQRQRTVSRSDSTRDRRFDHFKTFSGRLERQLSNLRGMANEPTEIEPADSKISEEESDDDEVPTADRYFAALEGPELETLRATEVPVLPKDEKWPFLLRFPISAFGMCMGVSSQAMLWKTLASEPATAFLHVSPDVNHVLWWVSVALMGLISFIYLLKIIFYFEAVRREFHHPIRVNFFFAPWIACLFLVKGLPQPVWTLHHVVWYLLMAPIFCLDLKIYGQWMSGGDRRLSKVASPTNHLAVVGNFVGALLGARMGLREVPIFFFAVGLAHYLVLFVTLYQRLPTNVQLPKELHPVFFLFIAAPSVASMAWARLCGEFNYGAKISYFIALFLYMSLAVRINFFRGVRFSLAWWAYTFPMTSAAIVTALYASEVTNVLTRALAVGLAGIASVTVTGVLVTTMYHAFVRRDLFPNDVSIAITQRPKPKFSKILAHLRSSGTDVKELVFALSRHGGSETNSASESPSPMARSHGRAET
ncbi:S-type anion channel SLAH2-like [Phragmites australis]|uniref:S-type anion channel SLAH2-like n=1 Tax=Phragmites australis TaxID=29695 RepID=UPI002D77E20B|nr:S-type anion channel SLAH2-like [Phragmites australis]